MGLNPFEQGKKAFRQGMVENPFELNSNDGKSWEYGFNKAYFYNLERLQGSNGTTKNNKKGYKAKDTTKGRGKTFNRGGSQVLHRGKEETRAS